MPVSRLTGWAALNMHSLFGSGVDHWCPNLISMRGFQSFVLFVALLLASIASACALGGSGWTRRC